MLTERASFERKWRRYPELAKILSNKEMKLERYGFTSVSDSMFERTHRLLEISFLVLDNKNDVHQELESRGREVHQDLLHLSDDLAGLTKTFSEMSKAVLDYRSERS